ncbi:PREDICTED: protein strawberry notch homolog 1-like isoform X2 [Amphimedon queenslandica]|uniref:Strawberry notch AAA domain-containing protein n=1 Tax=Amphimedon queenslandica TaxID=400682 RepID=A0AAN0ILR9_AMPQE|nr:PREDICTED: protein strawberry notch homolog 1-like isoform X2 [Amphimedon queenslandica]|eukprot:XP_011404218.2 PREDICTED: protein strawberry notch homolog 1-like isoform X2 [Amphimedon queenslandica]
MSLDSFLEGDGYDDIPSDILSLALEQSGLNLPPLTLGNDFNESNIPMPVSSLLPVVSTASSDSLSSLILPLVTSTNNVNNNKTVSSDDDLSHLFEASETNILNCDLPSFTIPGAVPHPLSNTLTPPTSLSTVSNPVSSVENMDVNDVLLELGLNPDESTPSMSLSLPDIKVPVNNRPPPTLRLPVTQQQPLVVVQATGPTMVSQTEEDIEEEDDHYTSADTYATYKPAKLKLGYLHPDPIVESSSLASVEPPQVYYDLKYPENVIEEVRLSSLQLEAVVYACQQHMNTLADGSRAGFLIGDGAGVGKGRTVAGIIYQNYIEGRKKSLWLSVSNDLKYDAIRDLHDVGAKKISVFALNKFCYGKISGKRNGRVKKGVIFATYSSLIGESTSGGKYRTRFTQLLHWLGPQFDGVIVFDECHKAKNLVPSGASKPSKTGITVLQLQKRLPKARIVYCSATGASEPKNMAYMSRLGIWGEGTQFPAFQDFIKSVERRGVGAMELVAMDMKLRGLYIARQLSFTGVSFSVEEVSLSKKFIDMYDKAVAFWVEARQMFKDAADLLDYDGRNLKTMWGQFWAAHQRFFKYLCIAAKVPSVIDLAMQSLKDGKCVVIGLQSTGEARTLEQLGQSHGELDGFVSTAKGVLESLIKRHFPTPTDGNDWSVFENDSTLPRNCRKRKRDYAVVNNEGDDDSSSEWENSDSAVESSEEEDEMMEQDSKPKNDTETDSDTSQKDTDNKAGLLGFLGPKEPNWLRMSKRKSKKAKLSPQRRVRKDGFPRGNYSIKPPGNPWSPGKHGDLKFNYKTLQFERVLEENEKKDKPSVPVEKQSKSDELGPTVSSQCGVQSVRDMKEELLRKLNELAPLLPSNSLDELIDGLGGPSKVSEMTGRRGRVVQMSDGSVRYQLRSEPDVSIEMLNITEKTRFMDGEKEIAIISEAASSGISLQADRRAKNQKRRVHITLELPWSADKAIQQFGRTHRSNQVTSPEYVFLISTLSGEHRFASIVAKRLECLGALTHGDRRATESRDLSRYNIDTKYGRQALELCLRSIVGIDKPIVSSPDYNQDFFDKSHEAMVDVELLSNKSVDKESLNMTRFLNRLLGLPVKLQNLVFCYFTDTLGEVIKRAKKAGKWDGGILDFGASGEHVDLVESKEFVGDAAFGTATTQLHKIHVERGMSFEDAQSKLQLDQYPNEGFYLSTKPRNEKNVAVMLKVSKEGSDLYLVHRPNTGVQSRCETLVSVLKKYKRCDPEDAMKWWTLQYESTLTSCSHSYWQGKCRSSTPTHPCEVGMRRRTYYVLAGSLLGIWIHLENVFLRHPTHAHKMQIVRVHTSQKKIIGILIPSVCVLDLTATLERIALQAAGTADENPTNV